MISCQQWNSQHITPKCSLPAHFQLWHSKTPAAAHSLLSVSGSQTLLGLLHYCTDISWTGEILGDLDNLKLKGGGLVHLVPIDVERGRFCLMPLEISWHKLFASHHTESLWVSFLYADSSPPCISPTMVMSSATLWWYWRGEWERSDGSTEHREEGSAYSPVGSQ